MGISYDVEDAVVTLTIDRPEAMNCLDPEHNDALADAYRRFQADDALRCAVLTGAGRARSAPVRTSNGSSRWCGRRSWTTAQAPGCWAA